MYIISMKNRQEGIYSVSQVSHSIKKILEGAFSFIQVKGEISNFKTHNSGHSYFQLKDEKSQISCVFFKGYQKNGCRVKDGDQVVLTGKISVFQARGHYQILAFSVEKTGVGDLLVAYENLKKELRERGYFDKEKKKKIPRFPRKVGVITSPTGAVIQDMLHILQKPNQNFHVLLNPVLVQGKDAAKQIADAIDYFNTTKSVDLIVICRGGGSIEDLWSFNEKIVADSIYQSKIPLISAVGHETDCTIADYVADYRAPTPTAAAQVLIKSQEILLERIHKLAPLLKSRMQKDLTECKKTLVRYRTNKMLLSAELILAKHTQEVDITFHEIRSILEKKMSLLKIRLDSTQDRLQTAHPMVKITTYKNRLNLVQNLYYQIPRVISEKRSSLAALKEHLKSVNPHNILKRGFCIPFQENTNSIIMGADKTHKNQNITLKFHNGSVKTQVQEVCHGQKKRK